MLFHGQGVNGQISMRPYDAAEVFDTLNRVAPFEWRAFFEQRLNSTAAAIPAGGIEGGGYKLTYTDAPNMFSDPVSAEGGVNALGSLGIAVTSDGTVTSAWPGRAAYLGGISNGMKIFAVNGRRFSSDEFKRALARSKTAPDPLVFIVENASYFTTVTLDYHDGLRYPHLERIEGRDDVLTTIAAPRVP
jgi:predicted metalloprotease with PDZ domain